MPIFSIAKYTFREYLKERVLVVVLVFAFLLMASSFVISPLAVGAQKKILIDLGLSSVSIVSVLLIVLLGAGSFYREKEKGILAMMLSKPISRVDFLLGKYLGMIITIIMVMLSMSLLFLAVMLLNKTTITSNILWALYLSVVEMALIGSVMVLFSSFSSPVLSAFFTICIFVSGHLSKDMLAFGQQFGSGIFKAVSKSAFIVLPNLSLFNVRPEAVHNLAIQDGFLYSVTLYGVFYTTLVLFVSSAIFGRKEVS